MTVKKLQTRDRRAQATRATILTTGRRLFAHRGYPEVSVDEIVEAASLTKGALYHHFRNKREVFRGVVEQILQEILDRLREAASRPGTPTECLRAACHAYLDACIDEAVGRIVVLDSPAMLGWESWCKLNRDYGLGFFVERLQDLRGNEPAAEADAQMLLGALNVAGRVIAQADSRAAARAQVGASIDRLLMGLVGPPRA